MKRAKWLSAYGVGIGIWAILAVYLAFYGVWMSAVAAPGSTTEFYNWAVSELGDKNLGNSALVLMEDGEVARQYFGGAPEGVNEGVNEDTLFPTASFSKWVTAISVMALVESGTLDLDAPVSDYLTRWQLPDTEFNNDEVTVRRLLSHTAGLTDGLGFGDYGADEEVPTVVEELRNPRASSDSDVVVAVGNKPGAEFLYSGGGYLILQLLVEEVTDAAFAAHVEGSVLGPVGMSRSTYAFLGDLENASLSYDIDGSVAPTFQYASTAATGFASSAADLSNLVKAIVAGDPDVLPGAQTIESMREPHGFLMGAGIWGLGTILYAPTPEGDYVFGHDGGNDPAINSTVRINPDTSDAIVLLVSGHPSLASNIGSEWVLWQTGYPDFLSMEKILRSSLIPVFTGSLVVTLVVFLWSRRKRGRAGGVDSQ